MILRAIFEDDGYGYDLSLISGSVSYVTGHNGGTGVNLASGEIGSNAANLLNDS